MTAEDRKQSGSRYSIFCPIHSSKFSSNIASSVKCSLLPQAKLNTHFILLICLYFASPSIPQPDVKSQLMGKDPDAWKDGRQKEKGAAEDEMVR